MLAGIQSTGRKSRSKGDILINCKRNGSACLGICCGYKYNEYNKCVPMGKCPYFGGIVIGGVICHADHTEDFDPLERAVLYPEAEIKCQMKEEKVKMTNEEYKEIKPKIMVELNTVLIDKFYGYAYTEAKKLEIEKVVRSIVDKYIPSEYKYEVILPDPANLKSNEIIVDIKCIEINLSSNIDDDDDRKTS